MGRKSRKRPWHQPVRPLDLERINSIRHTEIGPGEEEYLVQHISSAAKTYRCPGCNQLITAGNPHVVAWRSSWIFGQQAALDSRRHWHPHCWKRRLRPN